MQIENYNGDSLTDHLQKAQQYTDKSKGTYSLEKAITPFEEIAKNYQLLTDHASLDQTFENLTKLINESLDGKDIKKRNSLIGLWKDIPRIKEELENLQDWLRPKTAWPEDGRSDFKVTMIYARFTLKYSPLMTLETKDLLTTASKMMKVKKECQPNSIPKCHEELASIILKGPTVKKTETARNFMKKITTNLFPEKAPQEFKPKQEHSELKQLIADLFTYYPVKNLIPNWETLGKEKEALREAIHFSLFDYLSTYKKENSFTSPQVITITQCFTEGITSFLKLINRANKEHPPTNSSTTTSKNSEALNSIFQKVLDKKNLDQKKASELIELQIFICIQKILQQLYPKKSQEENNLLESFYNLTIDDTPNPENIKFSEEFKVLITTSSIFFALLTSCKSINIQITLSRIFSEEKMPEQTSEGTFPETNNAKLKKTISSLGDEAAKLTGVPKTGLSLFIKYCVPIQKIFKNTPHYLHKIFFVTDSYSQNKTPIFTDKTTYENLEKSFNQAQLRDIILKKIMGSFTSITAGYPEKITDHCLDLLLHNDLKNILLLHLLKEIKKTVETHNK